MEQSKKTSMENCPEPSMEQSQELPFTLREDYLNQVTAQMRCKKARDMVAAELSGHIEDQTETYLEFGLPYEKAAARAVEQMGDPIEVGTELDRIHRPRIDVRTIAFIALLSVLGIIVQSLMFRATINAVSEGNVLGDIGSIQGIIGDGLIGFLVMLAVMFVDYSFLGKHPVAVWIGMIACMFFFEINSMVWIEWHLGTTNLSIISALMILVFAAIVYTHRNQGYKGIFLCLFWLVLGFLALSRMTGISLAAGITLFVTGLLTISFAVCKGWFAVKKSRTLLILWGSWCIPSLALLLALAAGWIGKVYQTERIRSFLSPYRDPHGGGYVTIQMRERLADMRLFGAGGDGDSYYWWYALNYVMEEYGIVVGVLLLAGLAILFGKMLSSLVKQQNRLGCLLGISAVGYLVMSSGLHVLASLTLIPSTSAYLPFFSGGTNATIGCYLLLGVYLSVHRNTMILSEKRSEPRRRFRISVERVGEE